MEKGGMRFAFPPYGCCQSSPCSGKTMVSIATSLAASVKDQLIKIKP